MMDKYLDMINVKTDVVFSFVEKVSMFCFDKLSELLDLAHSWVVAVAIVLLLIMAIGLSF